jgi:valyl-tRNA synthetase
MSHPLKRELDEAAIYREWEESNSFAADLDRQAAPFTIMIPPPNVTGSLHIGHALTMTLQDTLIRWQRMQGRDALWQPGTDHAGIATQMVVERQLAAEGKTRQEIGREAFIDRVWQWKAESGGQITKQLRRLGASLDWQRERFTMDPGLSNAVREAFVRLYEEGLIYRDRRLVNWDPKFQSALSDLEVESKNIEGSLWYIRYPLAEDLSHSVVIATTRPETMLADVALAVNPEDERYKPLIGKSVIVPLVGRKIPIIADEYSDPEKGTGVVKITPGHDFNDFEVGKRHNLPMLSILNFSGEIELAEIEGDLSAVPGFADPEFVRSLKGVERFSARKLVVEELTRLELLEKQERSSSPVPHANRGDTIVEPMLTTQWFCNAKELGKAAVEAVRSGETVFSPRQWENNFFSWMSDLQPWCISRQIWWGHRIPAWFGPDEKVFVARSEEEASEMALKHYGEKVELKQDEDVLDTWFSSALWPFATLGWPEETPSLQRYYPTDVLVTGFDIIFFWVARMMMMGLHFTGKVPFKTVFIHGLVRDEKGQKMSKSKGNVMDPLALIDEFGADSLRWSIGSLTGVGRDIKIGKSSVELGKRFITKLRSVANFFEMNQIAPGENFDESALKLPLSKWLVGKMNQAIAEATEALETQRFDLYTDTLYRFFWLTFCDWYIEFAKPHLKDPSAKEIKDVAAHVFGITLRLLHPLVPFVTEELWSALGYGKRCSLIVTAWPTSRRTVDEASLKEVDWVTQFISAVRTARAEINVPYSVVTPLLLHEASAEALERVERWKEVIQRLTRGSEITELKGEIPKGVAQLVVAEATVIIPLEGVIDIEAERARLTKEIEKSKANVARLAQRLENQDFISRAPDEVVEETRELHQKSQSDVEKLQKALERIAV